MTSLSVIEEYRKVLLDLLPLLWQGVFFLSWIALASKMRPTGSSPAPGIDAESAKNLAVIGSASMLIESTHVLNWNCGMQQVRSSGGIT